MTTRGSLDAAAVPSASALSETARAKVNLSLRVVGRRLDGYHDLESVVAFADCADRLDFVPGSALTLQASGPLAEACGDVADNLVLKAARLLDERVPGLRLGSFTLEKVLPVAAGIGGGSADAAAALRLLTKFNALALDDPRLIEVAAATGADVPVCLASRACIMSGVGETLLPLSLPSLPCVMVNPRLQVATKDVFAALGLRNGELLVGAADVIEAPDWPEQAAPLENWIEVLAEVSNDLEAPALKVQPVIGEVLDALRGLDGALLARMSGSGATCFALFGTNEEARRGADTIRQANADWWVHAGGLS